MKKILFAVLSVLVVASVMMSTASCTKSAAPAEPTATVTNTGTVTASPTATMTATAVNTPLTQSFNFESGLGVWTNGGDTGFTSLSVTTNNPHAGSSSVEAACNFTGTNNSPAKDELMWSTNSDPVNLTGKTVSAWVYIPTTLQSLSYYGFQIFAMDIGWGWHSSWVSLAGLTGNAWNQISWTLPAESWVGTVNQIGFQLTKGDDGNISSPTYSPDWTGTVYIDDISIN